MRSNLMRSREGSLRWRGWSSAPPPPRPQQPRPRDAEGGATLPMQIMRANRRPESAPPPASFSHGYSPLRIWPYTRISDVHVRRMHWSSSLEKKERKRG